MRNFDLGNVINLDGVQRLLSNFLDKLPPESIEKLIIAYVGSKAIVYLSGKVIDKMDSVSSFSLHLDKDGLNFDVNPAGNGSTPVNQRVHMEPVDVENCA